MASRVIPVALHHSEVTDATTSRLASATPSDIERWLELVLTESTLHAVVGN